MDFLISELNDLEVMSCDVGNAYLNVPCQNNIWSKADLEHEGDKTDNVMVILRNLYGLKSNGSDLKTMFSEILHDISFVPTVADP